MKAFAGILGLVLAVVFAVLVVAPMLDLQTEGVALGLGAPAESVFSLVGTLGVLLAGIIGVLFLIITFAFVLGRR